MNQQKIGQYFFILASVIAILDGALTLDESMQSIKYIILLVAGVMVGLLRHENQKEFILAGLAVVLTGYVMSSFFDSYGHMTDNVPERYTNASSASSMVATIGKKESHFAISKTSLT